MRTNNNILDQVHVASPCKARWDDMSGDNRARFCGHCQKHVFNLSAMTRAEAETLVRTTEGKFCGRFHRRRDGTMLTADCPTGQRLRRGRIARWCGAAFGTLMLLIGGKVTLRSDAARSDKPAGNAHPGASANGVTGRELLGEVMVDPAIMGDIVMPTKVPPPPTNPPIMGMIYIPPSTNAPAPTNPPAIMGRICLPPSTNAPSPAEK
jgi:hypothetical protein